MIGPFSRTGLPALGIALYGGPVLAGLARHDWSVLPVLAALFLLYVAATRKPDLATGAGWAGLAIMAATQIGLVTTAWAAGMLLASLIGAVTLPLWAPLAITATAAGLGAWALRDAAEMDLMLDRALTQLAEMDTGAVVQATDATWPQLSPEAGQAVDRALAALRSQPGAEADRIDPILRRLYTEAGVAGFDPLFDAAGRDGVENEPVVDTALLRFTALPEVFEVLAARGEAGLAPMLLLNAPEEMVRAAARARILAMIEAGAPRTQLPDPAWLKELARTFPGEDYNRILEHCRRGTSAPLAAEV